MRNEKITPLYERLSRDDELQGESTLTTKATRFYKKRLKVRITSQTIVYRFFEVCCRTSLPVSFVWHFLWR